MHDRVTSYLIHVMSVSQHGTVNGSVQLQYVHSEYQLRKLQEFARTLTALLHTIVEIWKQKKKKLNNKSILT